jgi:hypothetical protein
MCYGERKKRYSNGVKAFGETHRHRLGASLVGSLR